MHNAWPAPRSPESQRESGSASSLLVDRYGMVTDDEAQWDVGRMRRGGGRAGYEG